MNRAAAINFARVGAQKLWAGTVHIHPNAKTGAHHHGALESVIYVVKGRARMRWGEHLEYTAEAGPGDFIYVPPYVPHRRSTPRATRRWNACWCAATTRRWWSTSISSRSRSRKTVPGSTRPIRIRTSTEAARVPSGASPFTFLLLSPLGERSREVTFALGVRGVMQEEVFALTPSPNLSPRGRGT